MQEKLVIEEDLDPQDWDSMEELGKQMVADMLDYLKTVRERKIWQPIPEEVKEKFDQPTPMEGNSPKEIYKEFKENVLNYNMGNVHPEFWGWVIGTGTPFGALADFLASIMNPNQGGGEHAANYIETQVLNWCKDMLNYPVDASGILLSGGSMANLVGLTVARNTKIPEIREEGIFALGKQFTVYGSDQMHSSIDKAIEILGIGNKNLRKIPTNDKFQIDIEKLKLQLEGDIAAGMIPFCIVGNCGTVNTGAIDDLESLAQIAKEHNLWFHVDGAFGALVNLSPTYRGDIKGFNLADSLAFDLHKWMYVNYEVGVTLVRDRKSHYQAFALTPDYLAHSDRGVHSGEIWFSDYGLQLSRGFRSLKVWMSFKEHGIKKYGRLIEQNIEQAKYLKQLVDGESNLEIMAPVPMNIVCYRFNPGNLDQEKLNDLNTELLIQLHVQAVAVPSYTYINGAYVIRVAITNHRSRREDFDKLVQESIRIGNELS